MLQGKYTKPKRLLTRDGHFNVVHKGFSWLKLWKADLYHYICNLSWWKIIFLSLFYYLVVNTFFGTLFWFELDGIGGLREEASWVDAFFFSVQTMATIGYGAYFPKARYIHVIVCIEAWFTYLTNVIFTGLIITKIQRPSRLRHTVEFSQVAVINSVTPSYHPDNNDWNPTGTYSKGVETLSFRIYNLRKRQLCMPDLRLLLLRKEEKNYVIHEINYDINRQMGRPRNDSFSKPHLQLPWTVVHTIDQCSPLYGKSKSEMIAREYEIICVLDGVDELTSLNFQCRWSYVPEEILWDHVFVPLVRRNKTGTFEIDFLNLSGMQ